MRKGNIDKTAKALGISQRRVHGLVAEGVFPRPQRGMHDIAKCRRLYERYRLATDKAYRIQCEREACQRRNYALWIKAEETDAPSWHTKRLAYGELELTHGRHTDR